MNVAGRWLSLSIRELILATAFIAAALAWFIEHQKLAGLSRDCDGFNEVAASAMKIMVRGPTLIEATSGSTIAGEYFECTLRRGEQPPTKPQSETFAQPVD